MASFTIALASSKLPSAVSHLRRVREQDPSYSSSQQKGKISLDSYETKLYIRRKQDNRLFRLFDILQSSISIEDVV